MSDTSTTIQELKQKIAAFVHERDWEQFHNPKNLSTNLMCEAGELLEIFTWTPENKSQELVAAKRTEIEHEVADILLSLLEFCNHTNIDLVQAFERKFKLIQEKYPVEKAKSKPDKYTDLLS